MQGAHPTSDTRPPVLALLVVTTLLCCLFAVPASSATHRAWSGRGDGGRDIFYETAAEPGIVVPVTSGPADDITPALSRDGEGRLRLFWVRRDAAGQSLYGSSLAGPTWDIPRRLPTDGISVSHPAAILDHRGVLWLAWTGFDGQDDDIYIMSLEAGTWSPPVQVNRDDAVPDLHPVLGLDEAGAPWLYWRGFDGRAYSGYVSLLRNGAWTPEKSLNGTDSYRQLIFEEMQAIDPALLSDDREGTTTLREGQSPPAALPPP